MLEGVVPAAHEAVIALSLNSSQPTGWPEEPCPNGLYGMQKNSFSALVNAALAGKPQTVTRRGTPVVVVAAKDYNRLCQAKKDSAPTFVDHLLTFLQGDEEFERMPLETRPLDI